MMQNPFAPASRRHEETAPKNTFQRELEAKMRDRHSRGLSSGITPDPSEHDSGDELDSDNELMTHFNMTSKRPNRSTPTSEFSTKGGGRKSPWDRSSPQDAELRKSPYGDRKQSAVNAIFGRKGSHMEDDEDDEDEGLGGNLMMTMKKPMTNTWQPPGSKQRNTTPSPKFRKSKGMGSLNEDQDEMYNKPWQPPASRRFGGTDKENENPRSKSPGFTGRKTPSILDSLDADDYPQPTPRSRSKGRSVDEDESPRPVPRSRQKRDDKERPRSRGTPTSELHKRSGTPKDEDELDGKSPRQTRRKSVLDMMDDTPTPKGKGKPKKKRSLLEDSDDSLDEEVKRTAGRKSPFQRYDSDRKSPYDKNRRSPLDREDSNSKRKSPFDSKYGQRKSPFQEGRRSITFEDEERARKSPLGSRKPSLKSRSTLNDDDDTDWPRKSPSAGRKSPFGDRRPSLRKRQDAMDEDEDERRAFKPILRKGRSRSRDVADSDEEEGRRPSQTRGRPTPKQRVRAGSRGAERDSSLCRDVERDPTMKAQPSQETKEIRKAAPRTQRKEKQLLDSAIDRVQGAQPSGMKYIDPDHNEDTNEMGTQTESVSLAEAVVQTEFLSERVEEQRAQTARLRPKPRYAQPKVRPLSATSAPTDFNSTHSIRDAVFQDWKVAREEQRKQELREKRKREKEIEEREKKEKEEKLLEAKVSYEAWLKTKKESDPSKTKAKRIEEEKKRKKMREEEEKKKEAALLFQSWKEEKDALIREKEQSKKRKEEKERRKKQDEEAEKQKDAKHAFRGWEKTKKERVEEQKRDELRAQKSKERAERKAKEEREREAMRSYEDWLHDKEKYQRRKAKTERLKTYYADEEDEEAKPAWSPAGRTIPFGR